MSARALLAFLLAGFTFSSAEAACPARLHVGFGDTLASIARTCGINVEALRAVNPGLGAGLDADTLRPGMIVAVPRQALPSPQQPVGRPSVRVAPSLTPPATSVSPPTLTLPPPPLVEHPQVPPGFDNRPRHMRPDAPHAPFQPLPDQWN